MCRCRLARGRVWAVLCRWTAEQRKGAPPHGGVPAAAPLTALRPRPCWQVAAPHPTAPPAGPARCARAPENRPPPSPLYRSSPSPTRYTRVELASVLPPAGRRAARSTRTARATSAWAAFAPLVPHATTASRTPARLTSTAVALTAAACPAAGVSAPGFLCPPWCPQGQAAC